MRLKANVRNSNKLVWVCFCGVSLHLGWPFGQLGFNKRSGDHTTEEYWTGIAFGELSVCVTKIEAPRCIFYFLKN